MLDHELLAKYLQIIYGKLLKSTLHFASQVIFIQAS